MPGISQHAMYFLRCRIIIISISIAYMHCSLSLDILFILSFIIFIKVTVIISHYTNVLLIEAVIMIDNFKETTTIIFNNPINKTIHKHTSIRIYIINKTVLPSYRTEHGERTDTHFLQTLHLILYSPQNRLYSRESLRPRVISRYDTLGKNTSTWAMHRKMDRISIWVARRHRTGGR